LANSAATTETEASAGAIWTEFAPRSPRHPPKKEEAALHPPAEPMRNHQEAGRNSDLKHRSHEHMSKLSFTRSTPEVAFLSSASALLSMVNFVYTQIYLCDILVPESFFWRVAIKRHFFRITPHIETRTKVTSNQR
jgi:hypothetical protein